MMKKQTLYKLTALFLILFSFMGEALARCCSYHGGVIGCDERYGRYVCADRTLSRCGCVEEREHVFFFDFGGSDDGYRHHHKHYHRDY